jgi:hypothetical protein
MADGVQGYLVVTVVEASGKSRDDTYVWDDATKEGYVKGETRGDNALLSQTDTVGGRVARRPHSRVAWPGLLLRA